MWSTGKGAIFVGGNDVVRAVQGGECGALEKVGGENEKSAPKKYCSVIKEYSQH